MSIHLQREIDKLKRDLLLICSIVEDVIYMVDGRIVRHQAE